MTNVDCVQHQPADQTRAAGGRGRFSWQREIIIVAVSAWRDGQTQRHRHHAGP